MTDLPQFGDFEARFRGYGAAKIAILPIPFDKTSSWGKGADKGPAALLDASQYLENYDIETETEVFRRGIYTAPPVLAEAPEAMIQQGCEAAAALLDAGKIVAAIGGEHSVTEGPLKACAARHPGLSVLQLDAHGDRRSEYQGTPYSHACIMHRARQYADRIASVGVRSIDASERAALERDKIVYAWEAQTGGDWVRDTVGWLGEAVYVTIDLDCFDPSELPATGTPEPGGLGWRTVLDVLRETARRRRVVGFDIVELCPDGTRPSPFLAAKLLYTFLSYIYAYNPPA